jgi:CTP:molybdopterin cytidylyltransferase MocA
MQLALELAELGEAMFRQRMVRDRPELTEGEIDALIQAWRQRRPGAEHGDAHGTPVAWPRRP